MAGLAQTLHLATEGYHTEPDRLRGQPLAIASIYHVLFSPVPAPAVVVTPERVFDVQSPGVFRRVEIDFSE